MLTATDNVTDLEILEGLDFHEDQVCEFHKLGSCNDKATIYVKRPPCPCAPSGRVIAVCTPWAQKHFSPPFMVTMCCNKRFPSSEVVEVGRVL